MWGGGGWIIKQHRSKFFSAVKLEHDMSALYPATPAITNSVDGRSKSVEAVPWLMIKGGRGGCGGPGLDFLVTGIVALCC
jgi:hypothetical protein